MTGGKSCGQAWGGGQSIRIDLQGITMRRTALFLRSMRLTRATLCRYEVYATDQSLEWCVMEAITATSICRALPCVAFKVHFLLPNITLAARIANTTSKKCFMQRKRLMIVLLLGLCYNIDQSVRIVLLLGLCDRPERKNRAPFRSVRSTRA